MSIENHRNNSLHLCFILQSTTFILICHTFAITFKSLLYRMFIISCWYLSICCATSSMYKAVVFSYFTVLLWIQLEVSRSGAFHFCDVSMYKKQCICHLNSFHLEPVFWMEVADIKAKQAKLPFVKSNLR